MDMIRSAAGPATATATAATPARVAVGIDRITVHGWTAPQARRAAAAFGDHLAHLVRIGGVPPSWREGTPDAVSVFVLSEAAWRSPDALGRALAAALMNAEGRQDG